MADIDPDDPEFNEQLKLNIRQRFINQVGPFKVVDLIHQFNRDVLTDDDIEHIKTSTRSHGNFVGAEELFNRLTQYKGWFDCLMSALRQVLPKVATKLAGDHDEVLKKLSAARCHEVHLRDAKGCISLPDAASRGHIGCIIDLIFNGEVDLNSKNERGETAVYLAAEGGHIDCMEILIQAGCNVKLRNNDRDSPLYVSAKNGFPHCVEALIKAYPKPVLSDRDYYSRNNSLEEVNRCGFTPVWAAAAKGHAECLKLLLHAGATANNCAIDRPDGFTPLLAATLAGKDECVQVLIKASAEYRAEDEYGRTPLIIAVMEGRAKCLQVLIEGGADINTPTHDGESPLFVACVYRHFNCVSLLLSAGADVHRVTNKGQTALMMAARSGDEESLQALIEAGSNLNAQDNDGKTALIIAAEKHMDICGQILVENGADIHLQDKLGRSAIHYAAVDYCLLLTILVDLGADVNAADNNGKTPLMIATMESAGYSGDVLRNLTMKGAKLTKNNSSGNTALVGAELYSDQDKNKRYRSTDRSSSSTCDVKENCSKDESSYKSNDMAPVSEMHHVHTLTRSYEVECCTEFEGSLQQSHSKCQKNPGHVGFVPITEFGLSHLPDKYRDQRIVDVIKAEAELTVRLLVKYTSPARPDGYNASNMRGKKNRRVGSGLITFTAKENEKCPYPECEASGDPKMEWGMVEINTAIHVVYDSSEAKETLVHIFADADKPNGMHKLYGYNVGMPSQSDDRCFLYRHCANLLA